MKWEEFIKTSNGLPIIDTENMLAGLSAPDAILVQISRWHKAGKLIQLKKGIYLLAEPYRKIDINEFYIACLLKKPSYISMEKALEFHGLIPEAVSVYTCITTKRPCEFSSAAGRFIYRHVKQPLFFGYNSLTINSQTSFVASPEKALLDMLYLRKELITEDYIAELRLQNTKKINPRVLHAYAEQFNKPGIFRAVKLIDKYTASLDKQSAAERKMP